MNRSTIALVAMLIAPATLSAQQGTTIEIGAGVGAAILTNGGTVTNIGIPGGGVVGQAPLYTTIFFGKGIMVQPEVSLNILSGGGETITTLGGVLGFGYAFSGAAANSPYVTVNGTIQSFSGGGSSNSEFAVGARVGYRVLVNEGFAVGFEGGYRRWFDSELGEITIAIRLGGVVSSP